MKLQKVFLLFTFMLWSVVSHAQPPENSKIEIINNLDGSISVKGITSTVFKDGNGNETTEAGLDRFLEENDNYTLGASLHMETGLQTIYAKKMWADESEVVGKTLSSLTYTDVNGKEIKIIDGKKPFLLCFWDTACGNCIEELNVLNTLAREFPELQIVALAPEEQSVIISFMEKYNLQWNDITVIADYKDDYLPVIQSAIHPTTVLISKTGVIKKIFYGNNMRPIITAMDSFENHQNRNSEKQ